MMETKKAYANIMLHSAQEAAARIMISERKAFRIQKEAEYAKQEALGMLLRLKQTMDSKMHEAEVLSFRQKKKIKELEGQLQEAKSLIRELREELAIVCNELERSEKGDCVAHNSESAETYHNSTPDASASILEACSNSKLGSNLTFNDKVSTLAKRKDESQSHTTRDNPSEDIPYLPSILKRTKVPPIYRNRLPQGIHKLMGNKLSGSFCYPYGMAGSKENLIADSMMTDSSADNKAYSYGKNKSRSELTTTNASSNRNALEKPLHGEQRRRAENVNRTSPLYEHLPTRQEIISHCPAKNAVNGSSPSEEYVKCSKRKAQKAIEPSRPTETCEYTQPGYVQDKENNDILFKPCSFKNTAGDDKNKANVVTREGDEVAPPLSTKVGSTDLDFDIMQLKSTEGSFPFAPNIIQYTRKRSRQPKEDTDSSHEREASPEPICPKRKTSEGRFNIFPSINNSMSEFKSSENWESQTIVEVAHQLLALSDQKRFC